MELTAFMEKAYSSAGVYAAGDVSSIMQKQLVIAAGEGSKAAIGVFSDLMEEE